MNESRQVTVSKAKKHLAMGDKAANHRVPGKTVEAKTDSLARMFSVQKQAHFQCQG